MSNSDSKFSLWDGDGDGNSEKKNGEQTFCGLPNNCPFLAANCITFEVQGFTACVQRSSMAGTSKLFPAMMKAWQSGHPFIASPMYPAKEPTPL
jgi:hypothetical protein